MSTNIHFEATRQVQVVKTGKIVEQKIHFNVWQSPTRVTMRIMDSPDPVQAYKTWILEECSEDQFMPIYADDDIFGEREPIAKEVYNPGKEHVESFEEWIKVCEEEGYTVQAHAW